MSIFQKNPPRRQPLPLTYGIEQAIIDLLSPLEIITDQALIEATAVSFKLVYADRDVELQLNQLVESIVSRITELNKPSDGKAHIPTGKSLGTAYLEWLSQFNAEALCFYLAKWDPERAYHLYWNASVDSMQEAIKLKSQHDNQLSLLSMEACMYGFGGKYKDDDGGASKGHDLNTAEGQAALKAFGF